jgi:hypothetical protein
MQQLGYGRKKDDGVSRPLKDYTGKPIINILVQLK